jgi:hypothetical protein
MTSASPSSVLSPYNLRNNDGYYHSQCMSANAHAPRNQIPDEAQELQEECYDNIPETVNSCMTEDTNTLSACPSDPPDPTGDHFVHEPLQPNTASVRLVEVLPPHVDGIIRCLIKHTEIGHQYGSPDYTCLSYTWGSANTTHWILMNGKPMKVGQNLWEFLCAASQVRAEFWYPWYPWYCALWIDALCINQLHDQEKNHQVQQMGRIYRNAWNVIVWLGNDANIATLLRWNGKEYTASMREIMYRNLDQLAYWNRAWVVQEVYLAVHVDFLSQGVSISLKRLRRMVSSLAIPSVKLQLTELLNLATGYSKQPQRSSLIQNLEHYRHRECKDLRDRVYSALSISRDGKYLSVNYDCSLVELARSTLLAKKVGVCLSGVLTLLQLLQLESNASNQEKCCLLIGLPRSRSLEHIRPCAHCGESSSTLPESISLPTVVEIRYICLRCNHYKLLAYEGVHTSSHKGHLCLVRVIESDFGSHEWQLFWTAYGGVAWRKLESHISVSTTEARAFQSFRLSLNLVCELMHLVNLRKSEELASEHEHIRLKTYSVYKARWEVIP